MTYSPAITDFLATLDKHHRAFAEEYITQHLDYPFGEAALLIDASIYADYMVKERPWVDVVLPSNSD